MPELKTTIPPDLFAHAKMPNLGKHEYGQDPTNPYKFPQYYSNPTYNAKL